MLLSEWWRRRRQQHQQRRQRWLNQHDYLSISYTGAKPIQFDVRCASKSVCVRALCLLDIIWLHYLGIIYQHAHTQTHTQRTMYGVNDNKNNDGNSSTSSSSSSRNRSNHKRFVPLEQKAVSIKDEVNISKKNHNVVNRKTRDGVVTGNMLLLPAHANKGRENEAKDKENNGNNTDCDGCQVYGKKVLR